MVVREIKTVPMIARAHDMVVREIKTVPMIARAVDVYGSQRLNKKTTADTHTAITTHPGLYTLSVWTLWPSTHCIGSPLDCNLYCV